MAVAALPAAVWWALGSAAAGGAAAKATGNDWKKGAALGSLGGLGLSALLAPAAAGGAAAAGAGTAAGEGALASGVGMGASLTPAAAEASAALGASAAGTGGVSALAGKTAGSTLLSEMLKGGATSVAMQGASSAMTPETEMITPGQPLSMNAPDPNSVFQLIQQLKHRQTA